MRNTLNGAGNRCWMARYWPRRSIGCHQSRAIRRDQPGRRALVGTLASRLGNGALCFIDYGFPASQYYLAERRGGTLACHYQQRVHFDPLILAGLQDDGACRFHRDG